MECSTRIHLFILCLSLSLFSCFSLDATLSSLDLENPVLNVKPLPLPGDNSKHGSKDSLSCERIHIAGLSRLNLRKYASSIRFTLAPSVVIPEKLHSRIHVCLHGNASLGLCQCEKDEWRSVQKGVWSSMISPYGEQYVDVKFIGDISGSVTASIEEVFQPWRLICLAVGFVLLLAAPVLSSWVPFYYSSSMFIGVVLVVIILLFQGMKLLPTGRKNIFYLTIYGSVLGAGSFLLHHFSMLVNSILVNFGLSEEMHNPVSVFLLLGIVLSGAALGYWIMRRFVISEDGSVDVGVAQFVKWAMRIVATTFILQSSSDTPLALATVALCWAAYSFIARLTRKADGKNLWRKSGQTTPNHRRAEFLRRRVMSSPQGKLWNSPGSASPFSPSPVKGLISPSPAKSTSSQKNYYSSFHKVAKRKKMTKTELEKLKRDTTREAMIQMASTPEFTDWIIEHADRIQILPEDSSDETIGSGSDSTDETAVVDRDVRGLFW